MHLAQLNRECLLHLFSFLDKDSRKSLSHTCHQLREVFLDPCLWTLLHFSSPCELRKDNFVLGPSLRYLTISWYSSRVLQVCNIEDWLKSSFQKDICSKHESLVSTFLARVCHMWVFVFVSFALLNIMLGQLIKKINFCESVAKQTHREWTKKAVCYMLQYSVKRYLLCLYSKHRRGVESLSLRSFGMFYVPLWMLKFKMLLDKKTTVL